jgi:TfoX/Sxy family transcriptional regulator of competence genes
MKNEPKKAILDNFFSENDDVRVGKMFGYPAYYIGRSMFACLYDGKVGLKLPEASAYEARGIKRTNSECDSLH